MFNDVMHYLRSTNLTRATKTDYWAWLQNQSVFSTPKKGFWEESHDGITRIGEDLVLERYAEYELQLTQAYRQLGGLKGCSVAGALSGLPPVLPGCTPCQAKAYALLRASGGGALTGGPGTGKTWLLAQIIKNLPPYGVMIAAPTALAARVLSGKLGGRKVTTIHSMLEWYPGEKPMRNEDFPLECDYLVIDEASMIDTEMMSYILAAIPSNKHLIICGDVDQLPPVSPGRPFQWLLQQDIAVARLDQQMRGSAGLVELAHDFVKTGAIAKRYNGLYVIVDKKPAERIHSMMTSGVMAMHYGVELDDIQVIGPIRTTSYENNITDLNRRISRTLFPRPDDQVFGVGDKVMFIENDPKAGVINGQVAIIQNYTPHVGYEVAGGIFPTSCMELAYATTVHKSQGAEYPVVVLMLSKSTKKYHHKSLIYTALSRAKIALVIVTDDLNLLKVVS